MLSSTSPGPADTGGPGERASGPIRREAAGIESVADAEQVLAAHGIRAELGDRLNSEPEFLRAVASAAIDAHERYPVLRDGPQPFNGIYAVSALADNDPLRLQFEADSDGVLAANAGDEHRHILVLNDSTPGRMHDMARFDHVTAWPGAFVPAQGTSYGLVMHEFGHATARAQFGPMAQPLIGVCAMDAGFESFDDIARVSRYSTSMPHEFFAEVFAQRNTPPGWSVFDSPTRQRLDRFAEQINSYGAKVL